MDPRKLRRTELRAFGSKQDGLVMRLGKDMTWGMFSSALVVLWAFHEEHDPMSLIFDVTDIEIGYVGVWGVLESE